MIEWCYGIEAYTIEQDLYLCQAVNAILQCARSSTRHLVIHKDGSISDAES